MPEKPLPRREGAGEPLANQSDETWLSMGRNKPKEDSGQSNSFQFWVVLPPLTISTHYKDLILGAMLAFSHVV